jgi:superfamily II DNA or RNA helicase
MAETFNVLKLNESTLRISSSDFAIEQELSDHFSFFVPNYKFMPLYRNKIWDGKARLYDIRKKTLPIGLYKRFCTFAKNSDYLVSNTEDLNLKNEEIIKSDIESYAKSLKLSSKNKAISLRDYQIDAIYQALKEKHILLKSPTSSGKSAIIYCIIRYLLENTDLNIVLVVPRISLVSQMYSDFIDYSSENQWSTSDFVSKLGGGNEYDISKRVLISTWQSIHSIVKKKDERAAKFLSHWGVLIGDEAHEFSAASLQKISEKLINAEYRIGTTGTVQDDISTQLSLIGVFGEVYVVTTTKELMDNKEVVDLKINVLMLQYQDQYRQMMKKADYVSEINFIIEHKPRNDFIAKLAITRKGVTLVLFRYVEKHGKPLYEAIKGMTDKKVYYISGETDVDDREEIRSLANESSDCIIVASSKTFSTGINLPSIENIIFGHPTKSKITNLQSIGRGLRLKDGKTFCNLYDIADDISHKKSLNHTLGHFKERLSIYNSEQLDFKIKKFDI